MPDLELQIQMDHMQHMLHPHYLLRVWRARSTDMLAELPMTLVVHIIGHWLAQADLTAAILTVREPPRKALATAPARTRLLALGVPLRPVQEARHAARYARKGCTLPAMPTDGPPFNDPCARCAQPRGVVAPELWPCTGCGRPLCFTCWDAELVCAACMPPE